MKKIYGKAKVPKFCLEKEDSVLIGDVCKDGKNFVLMVGDANNYVSFTFTSLHDVSVFRDFVRRAERFLKDSVKVK